MRAEVRVADERSMERGASASRRARLVARQALSKRSGGESDDRGHAGRGDQDFQRDGGRDHRDSERDLGRLVTFTDAVVAIAITLIVLPLVESARELETKPAIDYLHSDALNIMAAALSFIVIASFWKQHHRLYKRVEVSARGLVNANLVWLAGIIFLPVPSVLTLGNPDADALGSAMYVFTILVSLVAVRVQELLLIRGDCFESGYAPVNRYLWAHWITVALTVAALVLTILFPNLGPFSLAVVLLTRPINWAVRRGLTPDERARTIL